MLHLLRSHHSQKHLQGEEEGYIDKRTTVQSMKAGAPVSETEGKCQVLNSNNHRMEIFPIQLQNSACQPLVNIIMLDCVIDPK